MEKQTDEFEIQYERFNNQIKTLFENEVKARFEAVKIQYPELETFVWTQYTPSWNDGDSCDFSISTDWNASINGVDAKNIKSDAEHKYVNRQYVKIPREPDPLYPPLKACRKVIESFKEKKLFEVFLGNNVRVTLSFDKLGQAIFSTDDYGPDQ